MERFFFYGRPEALFGVFIIIALLVLGFTVWMLIDAITRSPEDFSSPNAKTGWIVGLALGLVIGFPGLIVALAYLFTVRARAPKRAAYNRMQDINAPPSPGTWASSEPPPPPMPGSPPPANCRNCGAKLVAGARFCHSCGTPVS
jgi:zinc ribbon protein